MKRTITVVVTECSDCDGNATHKCMDCGLNFCNRCWQQHWCVDERGESEKDA